MRAFGRATAPKPWLSYIDRRPALAAPPPEVIQVTERSSRDIREVNLEVNGKYVWIADRREHWDHTMLRRKNGRRGDDCENFALLKRKLLHRRGYPLGALRLAVCYAPQRTSRTGMAGHAVLCVCTDRGDYILDNLYPRLVKRWDTLPYQWISRIREGETAEMLIGNAPRRR